MQPNQQQDNVWISREEYERLRQQAQQTAPPVSPQPGVYSASYQAADEPAKVSRSQALVGALLAAGLFLSLTVPLFKIISIPILVIMLIFAVMSLNDFRRAKRPGSAAETGAVGDNIQQRKQNSRYHMLLVILLATIAAPVLFIGGMIILFFTLLAAGGGQGS